MRRSRSRDRDERRAGTSYRERESSRGGEDSFRSGRRERERDRDSRDGGGRSGGGGSSYRDRDRTDDSHRRFRDRGRSRSRDRDGRRERGGGGSGRSYGNGSSSSHHRRHRDDDRRGGRRRGSDDDEGRAEEGEVRPKVEDEEMDLGDFDPESFLGGMGEDDKEAKLEEERKKRRERLEKASHQQPQPPLDNGGKTDNGEEGEGGQHTNGKQHGENGGGAAVEPVGEAAAAAAAAAAVGDTAPAEGVAHKVAEKEEGKEQLMVQQGKEPGKGKGKGAAPKAAEGDGFDMFSASPILLGGEDGNGWRGKQRALVDESDDPSLQANWTDTEGYYKTRAGEMIEGRYKVQGVVGQGVFSSVLRCIDTQADGMEVALKMIRSNDTMRKAAQKEVSLLQELAKHDPDNRKHCVRLLTHLEHKNHTVMVFESLQMNLRETLKKFGRKVGINVTAVRTYAKQLFVSLRHLAARRIVHADIKPDNVLVSDGFGSLKLCDFGSAFKETDYDNIPTPYLVSRWYRAPEIILGLEYDRAIDTWAVATSLFELYTGYPMVQGVDNNDMLRIMMEYKGPFSSRMIRQHIRAYQQLGNKQPHFTEELRFLRQEVDKVTKKPSCKLVAITAPAKTIRAVLMAGKSGMDRREDVMHLADFLEKCLALDPKKRMTVGDAFEHPFLKKVSDDGAARQGS